jgi:hypothetical protein
VQEQTWREAPQAATLKRVAYRWEICSTGRTTQTSTVLNAWSMKAPSPNRAPHRK